MPFEITGARKKPAVNNPRIKRTSHPIAGRFATQARQREPVGWCLQLVSVWSGRWRAAGLLHA